MRNVIEYFEELLLNEEGCYTEVREVEDSKDGDYVIYRGTSIPVSKEYAEVNGSVYENMFSHINYSTIEVYCENNSSNYIDTKELYFHMYIGIDMNIAKLEDAVIIKNTLKEVKSQIEKDFS